MCCHTGDATRFKGPAGSLYEYEYAHEHEREGEAPAEPRFLRVLRVFAVNKRASPLDDRPFLPDPER